MFHFAPFFVFLLTVLSILSKYDTKISLLLSLHRVKLLSMVLIRFGPKNSCTETQIMVSVGVST